MDPATLPKPSITAVPTPVPGGAEPPATPPSLSVTPTSQAAITPTVVPASETPAPTPAQNVTAPTSPSPASDAPAAQPVQSFFLQNLQSMSASPFVAPETKAANDSSTAAALGLNSAVSPAMPATIFGSTDSSSPGLSSIPQERPAFPVAGSGGSGAGTPPPASTVSSPGDKSQPAPKAAKLGGLSFLRSPRTLIIGAIGLVVLILGALGAYALLGNRDETPDVPAATVRPKETVTLQYWGLWEPKEVMDVLIQEYEAKNPGVKIVYTQQKGDQYRQRLQAAIRDGSGPDIFRMHNTWLPMLYQDITVAPEDIISDETLKKDFYPVVAKNMASTGKVYGVPLMYEGLALLYNESMLEAANAQPPKTWEEVQKLARDLTLRPQNRLERSGIALGTTGNVDNFSDILGLMLLQSGANPADIQSQAAQEVITFFTLFSRSDRLWDDTMPSSTVAFATEKTAMVIVPSWRIFEIQRLNPNLRFGVTRVPQLSDQTIAWASYWVESVSKSSKHPKESWQFLNWLTQKEQLQRFHAEAAKYRGFGELYPRVDMAQDLANKPLVKPYLDDALYADSWYLASQTHDEGINDQLIQYYTDAVNEVNRRGRMDEVLQQVVSGIQQVLSRFGVSAGQTSTTPPPATTTGT